MDWNTQRICIFCETWKSGGIESFISNTLLNMDLHGLEIDIIAAEIRPSVFTEKLEKKAVRFFELSGNSRQLLENYRRFVSLLKQRQYGVIHINVFQGMTLYYAHLARQAGIPVRIVHAHNTDLRKSIARPIKLMLHYQYRCTFSKDATDYWACSKAAAEFLFTPRDLRENGFRFIPNGIDIDRFRFCPQKRASLRKEMGLDNCTVYGYVGRLCYQKNQRFLLEVFREILNIRPDSRLLLIGEGENRATLEQRANVLGIASKTIFYGTTDAVEELLWVMDTFAFPSRFEGLPIVAIEAQAAGLPVLCSENIPPEAAVTSLFHTLPLNAGIQQWAEQLISLAEDCARAEGAAETVRQNGFDVQDVAATIEQFYRQKSGMK